MDKRLGTKRPRDVNELAASIVSAATDEDTPETEPTDEWQDNATALTPEQRREIAKKAATARWAKAAE